MKKCLLIVSNIILSFLYVPMCLYPFGIGLMALGMGAPNWEFTFEAVYTLLFLLLLFLTPLFCILGIVLSVIQRKKENYATAFWVQFLPLGTLGLALVLFFFAWI